MDAVGGHAPLKVHVWASLWSDCAFPGGVSQHDPREYKTGTLGGPWP